MKYGHSSSSGLVGQEMKPETMKTWAYSLNTCCEIVAGLEFIWNKEAAHNELHKQESKSYIAQDENDRDNIRSKLKISIDIFDFNHHPEFDLVNIKTGKFVSHANRNVKKSQKMLLKTYWRREKKDFRPQACLCKGSYTEVSEPRLFIMSKYTLMSYLHTLHHYSIKKMFCVQSN